jgi:hypothetical protein
MATRRPFLHMALSRTVTDDREQLGCGMLTHGAPYAWYQDNAHT